jgi:hypothetical protein
VCSERREDRPSSLKESAKATNFGELRKSEVQLRRMLLKRTSMRRHCLSSRRGGSRSWSSAAAGALHAMLLSALSVSSHSVFGDSVHCEIRLFGLPRRRCNLPSGLSSSQRMDQVRMAQSPPTRSEAMDHEKPHCSPLYDLRCGRLPPFSLASWPCLLLL